MTDHGDLGIGGGTVAITAGGVLSVGGTVSKGFNLRFLGNGTLGFSSGDDETLASKLLGTISGFSAGNGRIDFSEIDFKAKDLAVYNSKAVDLSLERANGTVLANVFLNTAGSYAAGLRVEADARLLAVLIALYGRNYAQPTSAFSVVYVEPK